MKIGILGYGHFANVLALCLASKGHEIHQWDADPLIVRADQPQQDSDPMAEQLRLALPDGTLFSSTAEGASQCDYLWVAYDTPLDSQGSYDADALHEMMGRASAVLSEMSVRRAILSSQWSVGTTAQFARQCPDDCQFAYVPENIRVGHGVSDFLQQARIVVGTRTVDSTLTALLLEFTTHVMSMSIESAELSKHALNAFLALQIAYANEIGRLAAVVGADPVTVMDAVQSDARVSSQAPLTPGAPFGGGSLQRDVLALEHISRDWGMELPLIDAIRESNVETAFQRDLAQERT